jgi:hypothetical protein
MMAEKYAGATEYVANALTFTRGTVADVTAVYVYHSVDPNASPTRLDFVQVTLVSDPDTDPLASGGNIDVLSLIGPGVGADLDLAAGDWQRFVAVETAAEFIIRKTDVLTVL